MLVLFRVAARNLCSVVFIGLLLFLSACNLNPFAKTDIPLAPPAHLTVTLPGQQIWSNGVSSFVFGTNDTYEWSKKNLENQLAIQRALRDAGFTLIRSFFPDNAPDKVIEQRIRTIENIGAHCLGVITNTADVAFNKHLVSYLGKRCLMYEFGNEPDYGDGSISVETYLARWKAQIPQLRQINPQAVFIGPTSFTFHFDGSNDFTRSFLVGAKSAHVLPNAISFHLYPCSNDLREDCLNKASEYKQAVSGMRELVKEVLGKELPVGVTEWNYDPGNPPPAYGDEKDFITKFSTDALTAIIQGGASFACQFDAASYSGYGRLDMFDVSNNRAKPQFDVITSLIAQYRSASTATATPATAGTSTAISGR